MTTTTVVAEKKIVTVAEMLDDLFPTPGPYSLYLSQGRIGASMDQFFAFRGAQWRRVGQEQQPLAEYLSDRTHRQRGDVEHIKEELFFGPTLRAAPNASELAPLTCLWVGIDVPMIEPARMIPQHSDGQRGVLLAAINQSTARPIIDPHGRDMARQRFESNAMPPNYILDEGDRLLGLWLLDGHVSETAFADPMVRALTRKFVDLSGIPQAVMQRMANKFGGNGQYTEPHRTLALLPGVRRYDVRVTQAGWFDATATRLHTNRVTFDALNEWSKS